MATCRGVDTDPQSEFRGANVDPDSPYLLAALEDVGLHGELCVWDDPKVAWDAFDLVVIRSTWDYSPRREEFLDWAKGISRLANPFEVLEYSSDKHYLEDLGNAGHRIVPSFFCDVGMMPIFPRMFPPSSSSNGSVDRRRSVKLLPGGADGSVAKRGTGGT